MIEELLTEGIHSPPGNTVRTPLLEAYTAWRAMTDASRWNEWAYGHKPLWKCKQVL